MQMGKNKYVPRHAAPGSVPVKAPARKTAGKNGKNAKASGGKFDTTRVFALIVLIVCVGVLGKYLYEIIEAWKLRSDLSEMYSSAQRNTTTAPTTIPPPEEMTNTSVTTEDEYVTYEELNEPPATIATEEITTIHYEPPPEPRPIMPAAQKLLDINPQTVGHVYIPGCVDEPVVKGTDNEYYLTHNFKGQERQCGTCFADHRNVIGDWERSDNITLYAHNQKDNTMFGYLDQYRWNLYYWKENPFVYFNTNYAEETYVIISSFVVNALPEHDNGYVFDYQNYIDFAPEGQYSFDFFAHEIYERSWFHTGIDYNEDDAYLTLSTCSTEWDDSRHVIVARRLRDGETTENMDLSGFVLNDNIKWPAIYYKYNGGSYIEPENR